MWERSSKGQGIAGELLHVELIVKMMLINANMQPGHRLISAGRLSGTQCWSVVYVGSNTQPAVGTRTLIRREPEFSSSGPPTVPSGQLHPLTARQGKGPSGFEL